MPTQKERIIALKAAYDWEQIRLRNWRDEAHNSVNKGETNPMILRFLDTWKSYIQEVMASNEWIICSLQKALDADPQKDPIADAVDALNEVEHNKQSIDAIAAAAHQEQGKSHYFKSLDAVIHLEDDVRDYIEAFLTGKSAT